MSVLVYTESWDGKFKKSSFELVSYASKVAEMIGGSLTALSIGRVDDAELAKLGAYGAEKVVKIENSELNILDSQAYTKVIAQVAGNEGSTVVVLSHNNTGKAVAPRLAVRMKAALGTGMTQLPISVSPFIVAKKVYSGKATASVILKSEVKVLTLTQNSYQLVENHKSFVIESFTAETGGVKTIAKDIQKQTGKILLNDAEIVVSGGRGMKSPDNWGSIEELATLLGAATACSRPVSDEGWRPHDEHTGQTGKIISPTLYIAAGISGAIQHVAGISGSKYVVAINSDKDAPIFEVADYGVVGDAMKVLPAFIEAVKDAKNK
jgi:electron transfer flavoprotein alpha subunit